MSLFSKLLGRRSFDEERAKAERLFDAGELGLAKLAYERALDRAADQTDDVRRALTDRVDACLDGIARQRMDEATSLLEAGHTDLALSELTAAVETARSPELVAEAERRIDSAHRDEVRHQPAQGELDEEGRFAAIAGSWEDDQHAEYAALGAQMRATLLKAYEGDPAGARAELEAMVEARDDACYLWFEVGRARLMDGDVEAGVVALERFVERLGPEGGGDARLIAHVELAAVCQQRDDFEGAVQQYEHALEAMPEDPRPYLAMARFFRGNELPGEAVEVLEAATAVMGEARPEWRVWEELGLAHADLGQDAAAIDALERVVDYLVSHGHLDLPPATGLTLAQLHERGDNTARALDLLHMLCEGRDRENLFAYHLEAARLMASLELPRDARRMLQRALELAPDAELEQEVRRRLQELDGKIA